MFRLILLAGTLQLLMPCSMGEPVWLISNGFHTSIAVRRRDLPQAVAQLGADPCAEQIVVGWGAAIYYTARKITPIVFCRATCFPTPSALHVVPVREPLSRRFPHSDIIRFDVCKARMARLSDFLRDAVREDRAGGPIVLGPGYFLHSQFYAGRHIFWFPVTCNVWSARALRRAGVPVNIATSIAAAALVRQSEPYGRREQWRRRPVDKF